MLENNIRKKVHLAILGLSLALISAISLVMFQNFNVVMTDRIKADYSGSLMASFVLTLITLSLCEFAGGLLMIGYNTMTGIPVAEYCLVLQVKLSRTVLLSALAADPIATAYSIVGISMCGSPYGNCIIGLTSMITAILAAIFLKEKPILRVFVGVGIIIATLSPPEVISNFYLDILIS